jgi:hypothetical protein
MRGFVTFVVGLGLGLLLGWYLWHRAPGFGVVVQNPKEVHVIADGNHKYHVAPGQKHLHISKSGHQMVFWTFDYDASVDSVTAVFTGTCPFPPPCHFEFATAAAPSGAPTAAPGPAEYLYKITVYPHGLAPVDVDPGIIIDM